MASPIDVLVSGLQSSEINKSGNLQAGQAAPSQASIVQEIDAAAEQRVKATTKPAETLASFRGPEVAADPFAVQSSKQQEGRVSTNLQALKAFAASGSLADAGASTVSISA